MMTALHDTVEKLRQPYYRNEFAEQYIATRKKEQRLYTNYELLQLPNISKSHPLFREWQVRKKSAAKLKAYLSKKKRPLHLLEVGCGNGWLSATLAGIDNSTIIGIDINEVELAQAKQVFQHIKNLQFQNTDMNTKSLGENSFDVIVFAASVQYFSSLSQTLQQALRLLKTGGEIHIIDTHFYNLKQVATATQRTQRYYDSIGCSGMNTFYFHHTIEDLASFQYEALFTPGFVQKRVFLNRHPFHWIKINGCNE